MRRKTQFWRPCLMRLEEVSIGEFKNLRDLRIHFDEDSPYTVLVGENGAGKSNLIEALSLIFRNLDLGLEAPFSFNLKYHCRNQSVHVIAELGQFPRFLTKAAGESEYRDLSRKHFMAEDPSGRPLYRPAFVFGYYSGPSDRLSELYEYHRNRFYSQLIKEQGDQVQAPLLSVNAYRRLFYAQTLHGQFALLAFFMNSGL